MEHEQHTRPQVFVIGGPNGAGKTTCVGVLLPKSLDIRQFVNADAIAVGLAAFAPETVALQAGRLMLERLSALAEQRADFAFETTLASRSFAPFLRRLQTEGCDVHVYYVTLRGPELALQRVAERVRRGGHHVPDEVVTRRFARGRHNFFELYQPIADTWVLCDNSGGYLVTVARGRRGAPAEVLEADLYDEIQRHSEE